MKLRIVILSMCFFSGYVSPMVIINSPIIVSQTGNYTLGSDISFEPTISNTAAFIITTSDVVFDFHGHFVTFNSTSTQSTIDAVM